MDQSHGYIRWGRIAYGISYHVDMELRHALLVRIEAIDVGYGMVPELSFWDDLEATLIEREKK